MADQSCIRCGNHPPVERGLCAHCVWAVRAEIEDGFVKLRGYLQAWADFTEWCRTHEAA